MTPKPCIVCGRPRRGSSLCCDAVPCRQAMLAMPVAVLNDIRQKEALEAWQQSPSASGDGAYVHLNPRDQP